MKNEVSFQIYATEEQFLGTLKRKFQELFPRRIQHFDYVLNFSDDMEIQRSKGVTQVTIMATDNLTPYLLPEIRFSIIQEDEKEEWRQIVVTLHPYSAWIIEYEFLEFASVVADEFPGASVCSVDVSDELFRQKGSIWNGETYEAISGQINVDKDLIPLLIRIEEDHVPRGLKQREMSEAENFTERSINKYVGIMKEHARLFPNTVKKYE